MKKMVRKLPIILAVVMLTIPGLLMAQPEEPPDNVDDVPFDGGVSLLVAAGIGYGLKKAYDKKKEQKESEVIEK